MKQLKYKVEELHRGEWIPLISKDEKGKSIGQKHVVITEEEAEIMNIDSEKQKIRYVLEEEETEVKKVKESKTKKQ